MDNTLLIRISTEEKALLYTVAGRGNASTFLREAIRREAARLGLLESDNKRGKKDEKPQ